MSKVVKVVVGKGVVVVIVVDSLSRVSAGNKVVIIVVLIEDGVDTENKFSEGVLFVKCVPIFTPP